MRRILAVITGLIFALTGLWPQALNTVEAPYIIADTAFQGPGSGITGFAPGLTTGDTTAVLADLASTASGQGDALVATLGPLSNEVASTQHAINQELPSVFRWFTAAQQATTVIGGNGYYTLVQAGAMSTTIQGWSYQSNYGINDLAASGQTVRNNNFNVALGTTDLTGGTWTPTPTNLIVVGTPTYTGRYWIAGGCLFYNIRVQSTTSTAATAATTVFSFPPGHSPTEALGLGQCSASNPVGGVGYGNGVNYPGGGGIFVPAWSANADVHVSGWWPLQ